MKRLLYYLRKNDGNFQKGFLILSFVIFVFLVILDGIQLVDSIYERITSLRLLGDENAFLRNNKIISLKPIGVGVPSKVIDYFLNNGRISMRITALFYTLLTCVYLVYHASRIYIFSLSTFCLIFLNNYPILFSATDDSCLMFFLVLGVHQTLVLNNEKVGLAALFIALITKDISVIYSTVFIAAIFLVKRRLFFPIRNSLKYLGVVILISYIGGYKLFWVDKGSHQAANYAKGVSWFNVRAVSAIANYNNELKTHRIYPNEYFGVVKKLHIDVPNNQVEFFTSYPKEWVYDKINKLINLFTPHKVFSVSVILILFWFLGVLFVLKSKNNELSILNLFLFLVLVGIIFAVVGFFERRWIFAIEILFLIRMTTSYKIENTSKYLLDWQFIFYLLIYIIQVYMNRDVFFE